LGQGVSQDSLDLSQNGVRLFGEEPLQAKLGDRDVLRNMVVKGASHLLACPMIGLSQTEK
jgi:hypothetical protein